MNNGNVMYMPLPELQARTGWGQATDSLWLTSTGKTHASIDSLARSLQDRMAAAGYTVSAQEPYVIHPK